MKILDSTLTCSNLVQMCHSVVDIDKYLTCGKYDASKF